MSMNPKDGYVASGPFGTSEGARVQAVIKAKRASSKLSRELFLCAQILIRQPKFPRRRRPNFRMRKRAMVSLRPSWAALSLPQVQSTQQVLQARLLSSAKSLKVLHKGLPPSSRLLTPLSRLFVPSTRPRREALSDRKGNPYF